MPGKIIDFIVPTDNELKDKLIARILSEKRFTEQGELFIAEIKGHIDEKFLDDYVNFPPIFRNIEIDLAKDNIGSYMFDYMVKNNLLDPSKRIKTERKLTMLLNTMDQFMSFSSYYLWFLVDECHFIIDDIRSIIYFTKHAAFSPFVNEFMLKRLENPATGEFYKISMNGSYGYDGMNSEKFTTTKVVSEEKALQAHVSPRFVSEQKISDDCYLSTMHPRSFPVDKCLQEAYFTLDNAKYWYLNFVYKFMMKCLDMDRCHFTEGDTESAYWAIAGDPTKSYEQEFKHIVKDRKFYEKHVYEWFPNPMIKDSKERKLNEKKLLGLAIEKHGENMVALAPKCYTIWVDDAVKSMKLKGVSLRKNKFTKEDYIEALQGTKSGKNICLIMKNGQMAKVYIMKNALTGVHTKMIVQPNQCCHPFLNG
jgi:hypothetical protein